MHELRNCPICNSLFTFQGTSTVCQGCFDIEQSDFNKVKDYINEHPGCGFMDLITNTGVKEETLFRYIREGRLIYRKV